MKIITKSNKIEIAPGVNRNDVMKFTSIADAKAAAISNTRTYNVNVILGDADDPKPYWVASTPRIAGRLIRAGYEYA